MTNICIIHYNTPELTECLIKSINKFTPHSRIYIFDNSDKAPFTYRQDNIVYIDNTKGQIIDFDKWLKNFPERVYSSEATHTFGSAKHCYTVQKCIEIIDENFILMDSDILLKKDISNIIDNNFLCVGETGVQWNKKLRILPFLCYINVVKMKSENITYFDKEHMHGLYLNKVKDGYDTGCWFLCQVKHNLKPIKLGDYILHYGGGSWEYEHNNRHILMNNIGERDKFETTKEWLKEHDVLWKDENIIITLTTWKDRISNIPTVLNTILSQTKLPDKIVINLSREEFGSYDNLPSEFKLFVSKNNLIEINWIEGKNIKQWKKIIPTLFKYPKDCVICIDDDRLYPKDFIECLWNTHLKYPQSPITHNKGYKFKGKYLQHAGHGTLDKLEYYNSFQGINLEELYNFASSDTFFTLISSNCGHPIKPYEGNMGVITMYNEVSPLKKSQNTCGIATHNEMYNYLIENKIISNEKLNVVPQTNSERTNQELLAFTNGMSYTTVKRMGKVIRG